MVDKKVQGVEKIVLLDRDGVINEDSDNYIRSAQEWIPIPGSIQAISKLSKAGYKIFVVTNQSGLARGYFSEDELNRMHKKMHELVGREGGQIEDLVYCPHQPEDACTCRKPKPGLLQKIARVHNVDLTRVPFVGDSLRDIECAQAVGARGVLVKTGKGVRTLTKAESNSEHQKILEQVPVYDDLAQFVDFFLEHLSIC